MIDEIRREIDKLDSQLVKLLAERMELSRKIGQEKSTSGEDIHVRTREVTVLDQVKILSNQAGLDETFMTNVYQVILAESRRIQGV